jgi:hypothetical protein
MRTSKSVALLTVIMLMIAITAAAGSKIEGMTTLKDFQPTGMTDKTHKNQQYDLSFAASGKQYPVAPTKRSPRKPPISSSAT